MILNGLPWKQTEIILLFLRLHPSTVFWTLLLTLMATVSSKGFLPTVVDIMVILVKFHPIQSILVQIPKMSTFTLAMSCVSTYNLP